MARRAVDRRCAARSWTTCARQRPRTDWTTAIRYHHKVVGAALVVARTPDGPCRWNARTPSETFELTCSWLFGAAGYYRYDEGFTPAFEGRDRFDGTIVHPQHWPEDLDYAGKKVVVIGSGATAVTLIPSMADTAGHVTMLQRTPSYVLPRTAEGPDRQQSAKAARR